jgi:flagellar L-ring protein FlgH
MKHILIAMAVYVVAVSAAGAQSLWDAKKHYRPLAADTTARGVGDIVTIIIDEVTKIENDEETSLDKGSSLSATLSNFDILPNFFNTLPSAEGEQRRSFDGKAQYDKDNMFKAKISVLVQDVLPNGLLLIEGTRNVIVDGETKLIRIQGMVRPQDIRRDNSVSSAFVANATVSYEGDGFMTKTTTKGWFSWLLDFVWPF